MRVIELVGLGPGPFAGMLLADMGAEVLRVDRIGGDPGGPGMPATGPMNRSKRSVALDLKRPEGVGVFLELAERAEALIEVFRPGVAERLGIGPEECLARNPRLVYGRLTGWGQEGPWARRAGHDINYIALAGALEPIGRRDAPPTPPMNVLGDFAGGGLLLAFGIACASYEAAGSGRGQVVDAAMIDGAALLMTPFYAGRRGGGWGERGTNFLDTGAHFYEVYETSDAKYVSIGAIEPQFYAELVARLGVADELGGSDPARQWDRASWDEQKLCLSRLFRSRTRDEWCELLEDGDCCFAPVLDPVEAPGHPHHVSRGSFVSPGGMPQPAPAPRFSRTPAGPPVQAELEDGCSVLEAWGFARSRTEELRDSGVLS